MCARIEPGNRERSVQKAAISYYLIVVPSYMTDLDRLQVYTDVRVHYQRNPFSIIRSWCSAGKVKVKQRGVGW